MAAQSFEKADRAAPGDPETLLDLARAYSRLQDPGRSAAAMRRCLAAADRRGKEPLEKYVRLAKQDDQLTFLRAQSGFSLLLRPFE